MTDVRLTATNPEDSSVVPVACNAKGELLLEEPQVVVGPEGPQGPEGPPGPDGPPGLDGPSFNGQLNGPLTVDGSGDFTYTVTRDGRENIPSFVSRQGERNTFGQHFQAFNHGEVDPCFSVNYDGSAKFGGNVDFDGVFFRAGGVSSSDTTEGVECYRSGQIAVQKTLAAPSDEFLVLAKKGRSNVFYVKGSGDGYFAGTVTPSTVTFNLEPDNEANYVTTTDVGEEGDTVENRVYNGPTLDVKEEILLIKAALGEVMEKLRMNPPAGWEVWDGSSENS